jgi:hypothetical protein
VVKVLLKSLIQRLSKFAATCVCLKKCEMQRWIKRRWQLSRDDWLCWPSRRDARYELLCRSRRVSRCDLLSNEADSLALPFGAAKTGSRSCYYLISALGKLRILTFARNGISKMRWARRNDVPQTEELFYPNTAAIRPRAPIRELVQNNCPGRGLKRSDKRRGL